ncbi:MAG: alpha-L-glutamate ligase, partial [Flavobacteriia bacterium]|nr:alpha-L-glutamate ligase [Flavobacteriia bacterium]
MEKKIIGSQEWCTFERLKIPAIKARIDSGAKTSSIQSTNIKKFKKGKESWVSFDVNPIQDNLSIVIHCEAKIIATRLVKSSSGITEKRYVIKETLQLGEDAFDIELTLANREGMDFRML